MLRSAATSWNGSRYATCAAPVLVQRCEAQWWRTTGKATGRATGRATSTRPVLCSTALRSCDAGNNLSLVYGASVPPSSTCGCFLSKHPELQSQRLDRIVLSLCLYKGIFVFLFVLFLLFSFRNTRSFWTWELLVTLQETNKYTNQLQMCAVCREMVSRWKSWWPTGEVHGSVHRQGHRSDWASFVQAY